MKALSSMLFTASLLFCVLIIVYNAGSYETQWVIRYAPYIVLIFSFVLVILYSNVRIVEVWVSNWVWLVLGVWIVLGSLYARFFLGIGETMLAVGMGMLVVPLVAYIVASISLNWVAYLSKVLLYIVFPLSLLVYTVGYYAGSQVLHAAIFILLPLPFLFLKKQERRMMPVFLAFVAFTLTAILSHKNTGYLVLIISVIALLMWYYQFRSLSGSKQMFRVVMGVLVVLSAATLILFIVINKDEYLPAGSAIYRLYMYELAWDYFLASPLVGDGFQGSVVFLFELYEIHGEFSYLPTHSDFLDLLAHGGLAAAFLFLVGVYQVVKISRVLMFETTQVGLPAGFTTYIIVVVFSGFVSLLFNPVLLSPLHAFFLWFCVGVLGGLHIRLRKQKTTVQECVKEAESSV